MFIQRVIFLSEIHFCFLETVLTLN